MKIARKQCVCPYCSGTLEANIRPDGLICVKCKNHLYVTGNKLHIAVERIKRIAASENARKKQNKGFNPKLNV